MHPKIAEAFRKSLRIPEYESILDFFENGFNLTGDDRFQKFDLKYSPWIRVLCEWFDDPNTDWLYLVFGSQLAKTSFMMGALLYVSQFVRGAVPCLWVQSTEEEAGLFISERLRLFLDEAGKEAIKEKSWKKQAFRVYNAAVKVGYATAKSSLRSKPARYIFGDEVGIWRENVAYVKKRARTFSGSRKGIFATTPPDDPNHHSVPEMRSGNFYQWWVPCPDCGKYQAKTFPNLKWQGKRGDSWDFEEVRRTARYQCKHCQSLWEEEEKLEIINQGKAVCVDCKTYETVPEKNSDSRTLQINGLYSVFTPYGQLACDFLTAKASGIDALKVFFTDELAEVPEQELGERLKQHDLEKFIDVNRPPGAGEYHLYTAGIDVQRSGKLYYVIMGWKSGAMISGHVLKYGSCGWQDANGKPDWSPILSEFGPYQRSLYLAAIDCTDGVVAQDIFDFCHWAGHPFVPVRDTGTSQMTKVQIKAIHEFKSQKGSGNPAGQALIINSAMIKDEIAAAFRRTPGEDGAWSFHNGTCEEFLRHLSNEHRATVRSHGRLVNKWVPRYSGAAQHWFSSLVYATAAMENQRFFLQTTRNQQQSTGIPRRRRVRSRGISWQ